MERSAYISVVNVVVVTMIGIFGVLVLPYGPIPRSGKLWVAPFLGVPNRVLLEGAWGFLQVDVDCSCLEDLSRTQIEA